MYTAFGHCIVCSARAVIMLARLRRIEAEGHFVLSPVSDYAGGELVSAQNVLSWGLWENCDLNGEIGIDKMSQKRDT